MTLFAEVGQILGANFEPLLLQRVQDEGAHGHVSVGCETGELLPQALARLSEN